MTPAEKLREQFGKETGEYPEDVPSKYIKWLEQENKELREKAWKWICYDNDQFQNESKEYKSQMKESFLKHLKE